MFDFRTTSATVLVWLLATIQLLLQPAAGLLHSGCDGHSHIGIHVHGADNTAPTAPRSLWHTVERAWQWVTHSQCCQHSVADIRIGTTEDQSHRCSATCAFCSRQLKESEDSHCGATIPDKESGNSPVPKHDFHQCVICQVVFAARLNSVTVQLPPQTDFVPLADSVAVPTVEITPRFELPSRGPPAA